MCVYFSVGNSDAIDGKQNAEVVKTNIGRGVSRIFG